MEGTGRDGWFFEGNGKSLDAHGNFYVGEWVGGKYDGHGMLILLDGEEKRGRFKNGFFVEADDDNDKDNGNNQNNNSGGGGTGNDGHNNLNNNKSNISSYTTNLSLFKSSQQNLFHN